MGSIILEFLLLYFLVSRSHSLYLRWLEHDGCVCFFLFSLFSLSLVPLLEVTSAEKSSCLLYRPIITNSQLSGHYSVDFLEKEEVFLFQLLFKGVSTLLYALVDF